MTPSMRWRRSAVWRLEASKSSSDKCGWLARQLDGLKQLEKEGNFLQCFELWTEIFDRGAFHSGLMPSFLDHSQSLQDLMRQEELALLPLDMIEKHARHAQNLINRALKYATPEELSILFRYWHDHGDNLNPSETSSSNCDEIDCLRRIREAFQGVPSTNQFQQETMEKMRLRHEPLLRRLREDDERNTPSTDDESEKTAICETEGKPAYSSGDKFDSRNILSEIEKLLKSIIDEKDVACSNQLEAAERRNMEECFSTVIKAGFSVQVEELLIESIKRFYSFEHKANPQRLRFLNMCYAKLRNPEKRLQALAELLDDAKIGLDGLKYESAKRLARIEIQSISHSVDTALQALENRDASQNNYLLTATEAFRIGDYATAMHEWRKITALKLPLKDETWNEVMLLIQLAFHHENAKLKHRNGHPAKPECQSEINPNDVSDFIDRLLAIAAPRQTEALLHKRFLLALLCQLSTTTARVDLYLGRQIAPFMPIRKCDEKLTQLVEEMTIGLEKIIKVFKKENMDNLGNFMLQMISDFQRDCTKVVLDKMCVVPAVPLLGFEKFAEDHLRRTREAYDGKSNLWNPYRICALLQSVSELRSCERQLEALQQLKNELEDAKEGTSTDSYDALEALIQEITERIDIIDRLELLHGSLSSTDDFEFLFRILDQKPHELNLTLIVEIARSVLQNCHHYFGYYYSEVQFDPSTVYEQALRTVEVIEKLIEWVAKPREVFASEDGYARWLSQEIALPNVTNLLAALVSILLACSGKHPSFPPSQNIDFYIHGRVRNICAQCGLTPAHPARLQFLMTSALEIKNFRTRSSAYQELLAEAEIDTSAMEEEDILLSESRLQGLRKKIAITTSCAEWEEGNYVEQVQWMLRVFEPECELLDDERAWAIKACAPLHQSLCVECYSRETKKNVVERAKLCIVLVDCLLPVAEIAEVTQLLIHRWSNNFILRRLGHPVHASWDDQAKFYIYKTREAFRRFSIFQMDRSNMLRCFIRHLDDIRQQKTELSRLSLEVTRAFANTVQSTELVFKMVNEMRKLAHDKVLLNKRCTASSSTRKLIHSNQLMDFKEGLVILSSWEADVIRRLAKPLNEILTSKELEDCTVEFAENYYYTALTLVVYLQNNHIAWDFDDLMDRTWRLTRRFQLDDATGKPTAFDPDDLVSKVCQVRTILFSNLQKERHPSYQRTVCRYFWRILAFHKPLDLAEKKDEEILKALNERLDSTLQITAGTIFNPLEFVAAGRSEYVQKELRFCKAEVAKRKQDYEKCLRELQQLLSSDVQLYDADVNYIFETICCWIEDANIFTTIELTEMGARILEDTMQFAEVDAIGEIQRLLWRIEIVLAELKWDRLPLAEVYVVRARKAFKNVSQAHPMRIDCIRYFIKQIKNQEVKEILEFELDSEVEEARIEERRDLRYHKNRVEASHHLEPLMEMKRSGRSIPLELERMMYAYFQGVTESQMVSLCAPIVDPRAKKSLPTTSSHMDPQSSDIG